MKTSIDIRDQVEDIRSRIDSKLARFDRAFFHYTGAEHSPLSYRDEFEAAAEAVVELEIVLSELWEQEELVAEDASREGDIVEDDFEFHGFTVSE